MTAPTYPEISLAEYLSMSGRELCRETDIGIRHLSDEAQEYNDTLLARIKAELNGNQRIREFWYEHYRGKKGRCLLCEGTGRRPSGNPRFANKYCICPGGRTARVMAKFEKERGVRR